MHQENRGRTKAPDARPQVCGDGPELLGIGPRSGCQDRDGTQQSRESGRGSWRCTREP